MALVPASSGDGQLVPSGDRHDAAEAELAVGTFLADVNHGADDDHGAVQHDDAEGFAGDDIQVRVRAPHRVGPPARF